jgi:hypothetical protein
MPLADKLQKASADHRVAVSTCKLMSLTINPKIAKKDREALLSIVDLLPDEDGYIPNSQLAALLREEGYDISPSAVDRHRGNKCSCRRLVK